MTIGTDCLVLARGVPDVAETSPTSGRHRCVAELSAAGGRVRDLGRSRPIALGCRELFTTDPSLVVNDPAVRHCRGGSAASSPARSLILMGDRRGNPWSPPTRR